MIGWDGLLKQKEATDPAWRAARAALNEAVKNGRGGQKGNTNASKTNRHGVANRIQIQPFRPTATPRTASRAWSAPSPTSNKIPMSAKRRAQRPRKSQLQSPPGAGPHAFSRSCKA